MAGKRAGVDAATIHLHVLGQDRELTFPVGVGPRPVTDLLGPARELGQRISQIAVEHVEAEGRRVSCKIGCAACCRHLIPISAVEAVSLVAVVAAMPQERQTEVRRRFAEAVERLEKAGLLDARAKKGREALVSHVASSRPGESPWESVSRRYFELQLACPFLVDEACGVYENRPLTCAEYQVTTPPALCDELSSRAEAVPRPARMSEVLSDAANALLGTKSPMIPLVLALEWASARGAGMRRIKDGEAMFWSLLEHMETEPAIRPEE
ncbi:MAG: YkgJ family cysteine cluster protein [Byssovorax sp.]